ncbi:unnamed protein product [Protopolystoma xenopodis]|uniref:Uncharacterized protein n=1 Tax=Protopolystoma xenopodis TaxID=117903 RepID=A0A448XPJ1_9PLAT|nr:unnamed protein product [Protopolystoma xenopodis]
MCGQHQRQSSLLEYSHVEHFFPVHVAHFGLTMKNNALTQYNDWGTGVHGEDDIAMGAKNRRADDRCADALDIQ